MTLAQDGAGCGNASAAAASFLVWAAPAPQGRSHRSRHCLAGLGPGGAQVFGQGGQHRRRLGGPPFGEQDVAPQPLALVLHAGAWQPGKSALDQILRGIGMPHFEAGLSEHQLAARAATVVNGQLDRAAHQRGRARDAPALMGAPGSLLKRSGHALIRLRCSSALVPCPQV